MADEKKSFSDLLSEAPLAASEDTVSLVGALARSSKPGKFVLVLSQGGSVTLDVKAVKAHHVIGGGVGQLLVQVDVDRAQVPDSAKEAATPAGTTFTGIHDIKHPILDKYPWEEPVRTHPETDLGAAGVNPAGGPFTGFHDIKHPILDKYPWEEPVRTNPEIDHAPFALATAQQAPPASLSAMQAAPAMGGTRTFFTWDINTGWKDHYKNPLLDATGHPPYLD
jgi:hypothetical protein